MKNKKAQMGNLQTFVMGVIAVAVMVAVALMVLSSLSDTTQKMETSTASNESVTLVGTGGILQQSALYVSASACRNASMNSIQLGMYCNVSSTGVVKINALNFSSAVAYIDYTHYTPSAAYNSTGTIITKLATVPTWIGIIIVVALAFVVLSFFYKGKQ